MSRVLGVDPGFANFGAVVMDTRVDDDRAVLWAGVLRTKKDTRKQRRMVDDNLQRTYELCAELIALFDTYQPTLVCAEAMSFPRSASVAGKMCLAWGVLATLLHQRKVPLVQSSPQELKRAVCGTNTASKEEMAVALDARIGTALRPHLARLSKGQHEHVYDAVAAIVAAEKDAFFQWTQSQQESALRALRGIDMVTP